MQGTNVPIEPVSHMAQHSVPLWQVARNPMIIYLIPVNPELESLCVSEKASEAVMLHGHFHLTAYRSPSSQSSLGSP